jgi:hypothetical protein
VLAGPAYGALSGAMLGAGRQSLVLYAAATRKGPGWLMGLLPRFDTSARVANYLVVLLGGAVLMMAAW